MIACLSFIDTLTNYNTLFRFIEYHILVKNKSLNSQTLETRDCWVVLAPGNLFR